jgi:hypothetical protein
MKEVDAKASKCPHCQSDLRSWIRQHPIGVLILVLIFVPIFMSVISSDSATPVSPTEQIANMKKSSAESFARSYVKSTLKAPTTAKFGNFASVKQDSENPNLFEVVSDVTSENSYGAKLTSTWSLKMKYVGSDTREGIDDGTNWTVEEFYFDGKKVE